MPKKRKESGTRKIEKKIFILCEGADKHSEYAYLGALIKDKPVKGNRVEIELVPTQKNTGRELVEEASRKITDDFKDIDEAWVVYDQDGYTLHKETFENANKLGVKIAFSATSFEFWILLHYKYTTKYFEKSEDIIKFMKDQGYIDYSKAAKDVYNRTCAKLDFAMNNAKKLRKEKDKTDAG